jgi:hypothetical protein
MIGLTASELGWAWMDLNHRPLPYQGVGSLVQEATAGL